MRYLTDFDPEYLVDIENFKGKENDENVYKIYKKEELKDMMEELKKSENYIEINPLY